MQGKAGTRARMPWETHGHGLIGGTRRRPHTQTSGDVGSIDQEMVRRTKFGDLLDSADDEIRVENFFPRQVLADAEKHGHWLVFFPKRSKLTTIYEGFDNFSFGPQGAHCNIFSADCWSRIETHGFSRYCSPRHSYFGLVSPGIVPGPNGDPFVQVPHIVQHLNRLFSDPAIRTQGVIDDINEFDSKFEEIKLEHERSGSSVSRRISAFRRLMNLGVVRHYLPTPLEAITMILMGRELGLPNPISRRRIMTNHIAGSHGAEGVVTVGPFIEHGEGAGINVSWKKEQRDFIEAGVKPNLVELGILFLIRGHRDACQCLEY